MCWDDHNHIHKSDMIVCAFQIPLLDPFALTL